MSDTAATSSPTPSRSRLLTVLLADIRGYTRFTEDHGDEAASRLTQVFAATMREEVDRQGGQVIELRGDEALATFDSARQALHAAIELQRQFARKVATDADLPLHVGIGLDVGDVFPMEGGYRGGALNLAARLCALAGPGDVFASEGVIRMARRVEGFAYIERGEVQLKGLAAPVRVIHVVPEDTVPTELPRFTIHVTQPCNLPTEATPFIGRKHEVVSVVQLLRRPDVRLLTLTGPGGTGKTRLALEVARDALPNFQDGVFFVSLAPLVDPTLVISAIATTLGIKEEAGQSPMESLMQYLGDRRLLLVLDNFEHLLDAAPLVAALLDACPSLNILVTSQAVLRVYGEHEYAVPPLAVPDPSHLPDLASLSQYDAVALFIERARAVKADFAVTNENAPAVAEICARLEGLPLALELAATRSRLFPPQALLRRLQHRLPLLTGGAKNLPSRLQTLRGTIDWSYNLLSHGEQELFARLGVFPGGCTLDAAEAVCSPEGALDIDVLDGVGSLVEKSLLRREEQGDSEPRFVMLESLREYSVERLEETGRAEEIRRRHAEFYLAMAESAEFELWGSGQGEWLRRLEEEHDNIRAALEWSLQRRQAVITARIAAALWRFWWLHAHAAEARQWLSRTLSMQIDLPPRLRARTLLAASWLGDSNWTEQAHAAEQALVLFRAEGDMEGVAMSLALLGMNQGGRDLLEESLVLAREVGDKRAMTLALGNLGVLAQNQGDYERAVTLSEEALVHARELEDSWMMAAALTDLGLAAVRAGDDERGKEHLREALGLFQHLGERFYSPIALEGMAEVAAHEHAPHRAARLYGAVSAAREGHSQNYLIEPEVRRHYEATAEAVRGQLDPTAWMLAWNEGHAMSLDEAIVEALNGN